MIFVAPCYAGERPGLFGPSTILRTNFKCSAVAAPSDAAFPQLRVGHGRHQSAQPRIYPSLGAVQRSSPMRRSVRAPPARGWNLVAPPPLLLGGLPCRVTGIAGRLLFSFKQRITFCLIFPTAAVRLQLNGFEIPDDFALLFAPNELAHSGRYKVVWRLGNGCWCQVHRPHDLIIFLSPSPFPVFSWQGAPACRPRL